MRSGTTLGQRPVTCQSMSFFALFLRIGSRQDAYARRSRVAVPSGECGSEAGFGPGPSTQGAAQCGSQSQNWL